MLFISCEQSIGIKARKDRARAPEWGQSAHNAVTAVYGYISAAIGGLCARIDGAYQD